MKREEFTDAKQFLAAAYGRKRAVADLPRAGATERTGLSTFIKAGWNYEYTVAAGHRLWNWDGRTTGFCDNEKACCDAAKGLLP